MEAAVLFCLEINLHCNYHDIAVNNFQAEQVCSFGILTCKLYSSVVPIMN